jgi:hypothetical protein
MTVYFWLYPIHLKSNTNRHRLFAFCLLLISYDDRQGSWIGGVGGRPGGLLTGGRSSSGSLIGGLIGGDHGGSLIGGRRFEGSFPGSFSPFESATYPMVFNEILFPSVSIFLYFLIFYFVSFFLEQGLLSSMSNTILAF